MMSHRTKKGGGGRGGAFQEEKGDNSLKMQ